MDKIIEFKGDRNDFKRFIREKSKSHIFIKYYADWCGPCKNIKNEFITLFDKYKHPDKLAVYINIDECQDVSSAMKIRSVPTIQSYKNGMPDKVIVGVNNLKMLFE